MNGVIELSAPHNWCDRRCERCPLADRCPVPGEAEGDVMERLAAAVAELEEACREAGIDVDAPVERPPPSAAGIGLQRAAHEWAGALEALTATDRTILDALRAAGRAPSPFADSAGAVQRGRHRRTSGQPARRLPDLGDTLMSMGSAPRTPIRDLAVEDVLARRRWRVVDSEAEDPLEWTVVPVVRVSASAVIVQPAITIAGGRAYATLETRYYEDGGVAGEYFIHDGQRWLYLDGTVRLAGEIEESWLGYVSNLDDREHQAGSFSNRREHHARFAFYARQVGSPRVTPFPTRGSATATATDPSRVKRAIEAVCDGLLAGYALQKTGKVGAGNRKVRRACELIDRLKSVEEGRRALVALLDDERRQVRLTMMYLLLDLDRERCLAVIRSVAKERHSLEGMTARMNLRDILARPPG